jgi:hypothetical protein
MNDRPTAAELIDAVRHFLEAELLPGLTDARLRFQTLVAANVLAVAGRELASEQTYLRQEWELLSVAACGVAGAPPPGLTDLRWAVHQANERLCARIRAGECDDPPRFRAVAALVRRLVVHKLEAANPRYLASVADPGGNRYDKR